LLKKEKEVKNKQWLVIGLAVSLIVSLGVAGFFVYQNYQLKQQALQKQPASLPEATGTPEIPSPTTPTVNPTANWKTYTNNEYKLTFKYPAGFTIEENLVSTGNYLQVIVNKNQEDSFVIKASKDYLPGDVTYFLGTEATGQETIGTKVWKTYYLPNGYGDGTESSTAPIYTLQVEVNKVLYTAVFGDQSSTTPIQEQVLTTLQF